MKKKQRRILDRDRTRKRARRLINRWSVSDDKKDLIISNSPKIQGKNDPAKMADHLKSCSCWMCGNPRKFFKEKTLKEKILSDDPMMDLYEEFNIMRNKIKEFKNMGFGHLGNNKGKPASINIIKSSLQFLDFLEKHYLIPYNCSLGDGDISFAFINEKTDHDAYVYFYENGKVNTCYSYGPEVEDFESEIFEEANEKVFIEIYKKFFQ